MRILIADDHAVVRAGLKQIIADAFDAELDEATNGYEVLDKTWKDGYDVIVLDIAMPGKSGLDVLKELRAQKPRLPVLILSMYPEEQYAVRVLKAGASGYLTKESAPAELVTAIRKVSQGGKYVSGSLAERMAFGLEVGAEKAIHEQLSDREYQVFCMIASGKTLKDISEELALSVKTISTYRSRILEKMGMKSNAELTHYAIKNQLVD